MSSVALATLRSTGESPGSTTATSCPLVDLLPELITQILLLLKISDILRVRQTCRHLFAQTRSQILWIRIARPLLRPSWGLLLQVIPAQTIEDLVFRAKRLAAIQRNVSTDDDSGGKDIRTSFEGVIVRPRDSPIWLHLIRGRWLLVQLNDFTLELWDLDDTTYANPAATWRQKLQPQKTLDICIQGDVIFVARNRNLELYSTSDVEEALSPQNLATRSVSPFQSLTYPGVSPLLHNPKFYINPPSFLEASSRSVVLMRFIDNFWEALILQPQQQPASDPQRKYEAVNAHSLASSMGPIYGVSFGEDGYRSAILGCDRLAIHYAKREEDLSTAGAHTLVSWKFPDMEFDLPRPGCVAFDEATGICAAGMGSGRIWIGDAVLRWEMKKVDAPSIPHQLPHPDPRWPQLPPFYFWDRGYRGPHSDPDLVGEVAPGWSTAVDYYIPWRNEPRMYGGIQWFVENVMGIPGPARTVLFSTKLLARDDIGRWAEFVDVNGRMFLVKGDRREVADGLTLADVIERLKQGRFGTIVVPDEGWASDCMALDQHIGWYKASDLGKLNK
ncbi:hypothetical protein FRC04_000724 [Tulasnella sp. 424]|nr:hypothetical protein FRC04_000724 [Tulasnella sp. 424]